MTIEVGSRLPGATLYESTQFGIACALPPTVVDVAAAVAGKRIVIVGLIGAFTDTCSEAHVPAYIQSLDALRAKGIDEVWCVSVNDGFTSAAWGRSLGATGKLRFLGDGDAEFTLALGLEVRIPGMGIRLQRCSLLVEDGVVTRLNVEKPLQLEVSDAQTMLKQIG